MHLVGYGCRSEKQGVAINAQGELTALLTHTEVTNRENRSSPTTVAVDDLTILRLACLKLIACFADAIQSR